MPYVVEVSKEGFDVDSCEIKDMVFTSQANQYKISMTGSLTFVGSTTTSIAHGLSYTPSFLAFAKIDLFSYYRPYQNAYVDDTNLYIEGNAGDIVSYFIFYDIGA